MVTLLAALVIPITLATLLLARQRGYRTTLRNYRPTYVPGGPLPKRRPAIDEPVGIA